MLITLAVNLTQLRLMHLFAINVSSVMLESNIIESPKRCTNIEGLKITNCKIETDY